ncbi:Sec-independent protein translocase subunit TatA/TatB [Paenibacillus alba]|uniref:Sec-independent protein translocase protein TatA n=1 Tax=Paenibacillus alba TaxID=1197127 RepID=A0ABU6G886_9BACL|nr:twin-arginine translocase TatA/TatE family subunit [Paenibacillus alba]MEC0228954.1 twin-arginine translocase TatA/TatE family subunit [Paenibacillus alba]NQX68154.1 twin-arginine translocase TatA/TatE family subunit [Paenibacillus alba]
MGALSPWHIILIAIVALLLFGPNKLPELGRGFGKMFREFKDATSGNGGNSTIEEQPASVRKEVNPAEVTNADSGQANK